MDELSAALGCSQMERIEEILDKRAKIAGMYNCSLFIVKCLGIRKEIFRLPMM
jgi:perosamine synthetase